MYIQVTNNNIVLRMFLGEIWKEGKGKGLEIKEGIFFMCSCVKEDKTYFSSCAPPSGPYQGN